jgi:pyruvate carboxylase
VPDHDRGPANNFIPDYGRITAYRGATGMGIRLDGGTAYSGAVITRYYDSLLEKVTAWAPTPEAAIARMDRACASSASGACRPTSPSSRTC